MNDRISVELIQAKEEHIDTLVEFQLAMALESEGLVLDKEVVSKGVARLIASEHRGLYYLAYEEGKAAAGPIGCMMITTEWSDWHNAEYYWLQSVYVRPDSRGKGVFTQMLQKLERGVADKEVKSLRLYVDKDNAAAQCCYKRLGLETCHYDMYEKVLR